MTSKRSITSDLENAKDAVLGDLTPDERAALAVCVAADGDHERFEELLATAPVDVYKSTDREFAERMASLETLAVYALWKLDRGVLRFDLERMRGKYQDQLYQQYPDADWTEAPGEENGYHEGSAYEAAAQFLVDYRVWSRFAEEDIGVSLEEFITFPFTDDVEPLIERIEAAAAFVDGADLEDDMADLSWAANATIDVDAAADRKYTQIEV